LGTLNGFSFPKKKKKRNDIFSQTNHVQFYTEKKHFFSKFSLSALSAHILFIQSFTKNFLFANTNYFWCIFAYYVCLMGTVVKNMNRKLVELRDTNWFFIIMAPKIQPRQSCGSQKIDQNWGKTFNKCLLFLNYKCSGGRNFMISFTQGKKKKNIDFLS